MHTKMRASRARPQFPLLYHQESECSRDRLARWSRRLAVISLLIAAAIVLLWPGPLVALAVGACILAELLVLLTPAGQRFAEAGVLEEKEQFRTQALASVQLLRQIVRELQDAPEHRLREDGLLANLEQWFSEGEARRQLDTAIDWGRYAELFAYDDDAGEFFLEDEAVVEAAAADWTDA